MIVEIQSSEDLKNILSSNKYVLVDFYAEWCGPCKMMDPILQSLSKKYTDLKIVKVNIDEQSDIALDYKVEVMPTFILFKDNVNMERIIGSQTEQVFEDKINKFM